MGAGLAINSARGLVSREGMYDADSTSTMTLASWLGIIGGILMVLWGGSVLTGWLV
jgi:hypothetical protein